MNKDLIDLFKNNKYKIFSAEEVDNQIFFEKQELTTNQKDFISNLVEVTDNYGFEIFGDTKVYTNSENKDSVCINIRPKNSKILYKTKLFVSQF